MTKENTRPPKAKRITRLFSCVALVVLFAFAVRCVDRARSTRQEQEQQQHRRQGPMFLKTGSVVLKNSNNDGGGGGGGVNTVDDASASAIPEHHEAATATDVSAILDPTSSSMVQSDAVTSSSIEDKVEAIDDERLIDVERIERTGSSIAAGQDSFHEVGSSAGNTDTNHEDAAVPVTLVKDYSGPAEYAPFSNDSMSLPLPLQVLEQYKRWHSVDSLEKETDPSRRKFALGLYTCPHSAGNRLHGYMNHLLWAVMTNRTLLWKYLDSETCNDLRQRGWQHHLTELDCQTANTVQDCNALLERAHWIPSADDWTSTWSLPEPVVLPTQDGDSVAATAAIPFTEDTTRERYVIFPNHVYPLTQQSIHASAAAAPEVETGSWTLDAAERLPTMGIEFLYGMLFRYSFDFTDYIKEKTPLPNIGPGPYMVAIQSRHPDENDDGCDVQYDMDYIEFLMTIKRSKGRGCKVVVLTDRKCTQKKLVHWVDEIGCTPVYVQNHETSSEQQPPPVKEHGPFAGAGYVQDLFLGSHLARSAFLGTSQKGALTFRSSSWLVLEQAEFHRRMETLQAGKDPVEVKKLDAGLRRIS